MKTKKALIIASITLGIFYLVFIAFAKNGYGYMGYYGYARGPSFFYWGGPLTYYDRSVRRGSVSGSGVRGGGPSSGK